MKYHEIRKFLECFGVHNLRTHKETINVIVSNHLAPNIREAERFVDAIVNKDTFHGFFYDARGESGPDEYGGHIMSLKKKRTSEGREYYALEDIEYSYFK
jgi:hypothetical protein